MNTLNIELYEDEISIQDVEDGDLIILNRPQWAALLRFVDSQPERIAANTTVMVTIDGAGFVKREDSVIDGEAEEAGRLDGGSQGAGEQTSGSVDGTRAIESAESV